MLKRSNGLWQMIFEEMFLDFKVNYWSDKAEIVNMVILYKDLYFYREI